MSTTDKSYWNVWSQYLKDEFSEKITGGRVMQFTMDYGIPISISLATHPLIYSRTMMMLGHEPDPPTLRKVPLSLIYPGYRRYLYPSVFTYLGRLRDDVGVYGLFTTGLPVSIIGSYVKSYSTEYVIQSLVGQYFRRKSFIITHKGLKVFIVETSKLTAARVIGLVVSYPFQVIMVRQMAEMVENGAHRYFLAITLSMFKEEGILSFFNGLIPRVIAEVITVWLTACFAYVLNRFVFDNDRNQQVKEHTPFIAGLMVSNATHRFTVTSTVMAVSGSKLAIGRPFVNWWQCYNHLALRSGFDRGVSLFFRYAPNVQP